MTLPSAVRNIEPAQALSANSYFDRTDWSQPDATMVILNTGGMNRLQQQTLHVDEKLFADVGPRLPRAV
jgi:hypothetical protein